MKIQLKDYHKTFPCLDKIIKRKKIKQHLKSVTDKKENETTSCNLQTVLFILKLKVSRLSRQLEEIKILNKHLNQELETKTQQLVSTNTRVSMFRTQLEHKENSFKDLSDKYKRLEEVVGNHGPEELKIAITKLKRYEELTNRNQNKNCLQHDVEVSNSEMIRLKELVKTLEVSNYYNKQSFEKEVEHRKIIETEFKKAESIVESLTAENIKLSYEMDWNKTNLLRLIYKHEELFRKNASLQEYSDTLRGKYEALLLLEKKKNRRRGPEKGEGEKKIKVEEAIYMKVCEKKILEVNDTKANCEAEKEQEIPELDTGLYRVKETFENNYNDERGKTAKVEDKLERMTAEINFLQQEKVNFENRLRNSEENYKKLKSNFDELSVAHNNLIDSKKEEKMKINERIIDLNERLDLLGKRFIGRYEEDRLTILNTVTMQADCQEKDNLVPKRRLENIVTESYQFDQSTEPAEVMRSVENEVPPLRSDNDIKPHQQSIIAQEII